MSLISSAKPEENEEVQVAAESEDSESSVEENSVSSDEDPTNEEVTEEEKEV